MRRITLRIIAVALFVAMVALAISPGSFAQEKKPNIIFIRGATSAGCSRASIIAV
jgi:hypothetical protein